jgi:hypothetical protein
MAMIEWIIEYSVGGSGDRGPEIILRMSDDSGDSSIGLTVRSGKDGNGIGPADEPREVTVYIDSDDARDFAEGLLDVAKRTEEKVK